MKYNKMKGWIDIIASLIQQLHWNQNKCLHSLGTVFASPIKRDVCSIVRPYWLEVVMRAIE